MSAISPASKLPESFLERINSKIHAVSKDGHLVPASKIENLAAPVGGTSERSRRSKRRHHQHATTTTDSMAQQLRLQKMLKGKAPTEGTETGKDDFEEQFMRRFRALDSWSLPTMRAFSDILDSVWKRSSGESNGAENYDTMPSIAPLSDKSFDLDAYAVKPASRQAGNSRPPSSSKIPVTVRPASASMAQSENRENLTDASHGRRSVPLKQQVSFTSDPGTSGGGGNHGTDSLRFSPSIVIQNSLDHNLQRPIHTPAPWAAYPTAKHTLLFPTITAGPLSSNLYGNNGTGSNLKSSSLDPATASVTATIGYPVIQGYEEQRLNELLFFDSLSETPRPAKNDAGSSNAAGSTATKRTRKKKTTTSTDIPKSMPLLQDPLSQNGSTFSTAGQVYGFDEGKLKQQSGAPTRSGALTHTQSEPVLARQSSLTSTVSFAYTDPYTQDKSDASPVYNSIAKGGSENPFHRLDGIRMASPRPLGHHEKGERAEGSLSRLSSRSSASSIGSGKTSANLPYNIPERLPASLGPDCDSEEYKRKKAMAMRRKEYSMQVKQLRFPPQKIKVGNGSMEERHAEGRWSRSETASDSKEEARKSVVTKGKRTMRVGNGSFRDLVEAHERLLKMKHFAQGIKKPKPKEQKSVPQSKEFKKPLDSVSPLERMRLEHKRDVLKFEEFKKKW
ncbi:MAG: hypothetical protein SGCHY_003510 [Lobulomycetales sp.]